MQPVYASQTPAVGPNPQLPNHVSTLHELSGKQRRALVSVILLMVLAAIGFAFAISAYTFTHNLKVGAFWSQVAIILCAIPLLTGVCLKQYGNAWMITGLVLTPIATILTFIGAVIDALYAAHIAETDFSECQHSSTAGPALCGAVDFILWDIGCDFQVGPHSCYCCYLVQKNGCFLGYSVSHVPTHYDGVSSCSQVENAYQGLLWSSMLFNILTFVTSIVACALVGFYKSLLAEAHRPVVNATATTTTTMIPAVHTIQPSVVYYSSPPQVNLQLMPSSGSYNAYDNLNYVHDPPVYKP